MNGFGTALGWAFAAVAALFALGITPRYARRFYPTLPPMRVRLIAPILFAALSAFCLGGAAMRALWFVAVAGSVLIVVSRRRAAVAPSARHRRRIPR